MRPRSTAMRHPASVAAIQPDAKRPLRRNGGLDHYAHAAQRRRLEPVDFPVADRSAARQLAPLACAVHPTLEGVARDALAAGDVLLEAGEPPPHPLSQSPLRPCRPPPRYPPSDPP